MSTHDVTDSTFAAEVLSSDTPVLVDFWAEWCGPCKQLSPTLEAISEEMADKVKVVKLNVEDNPEHAAQFGIRGLPTMMLFKGGQPIDQKVGLLPKPKIEQWLNDAV